MSPDLAELLAIAEEAVQAASDAFLARAQADAEPADWRCYTFLTQARRYVSAAMVEAGATEPPPTP